MNSIAIFKASSEALPATPAHVLPCVVEHSRSHTSKGVENREKLLQAKALLKDQQKPKEAEKISLQSS